MVRKYMDKKGFEFERLETWGNETEQKIDYESEYETEIRQLMREQEELLYETA